MHKSYFIYGEDHKIEAARGAVAEEERIVIDERGMNDNGGDACPLCSIVVAVVHHHVQT
ncbi:histidine kinase [Sesbania bispinosa]|nr:histidine kinase [Sesbania bispinosa]